MQTRQRDSRADAILLLGAATFLFNAPVARAADVAVAKPAPTVAAPPAAPALTPGPLGVFGVDMPAPGKLVVSIVPTIANFSGLRMGQNRVTNEYAVTTAPYFFNPSTPVRIVPQNIASRTEVLGLSYGVTRDFTVVANVGAAQKSLEAMAFRGPSGIVQLKRNLPGVEGLTDFALSGIYRVYQDDVNRIQMSIGFTFPTGTTKATFNDFVVPNGQTQTIRGFYGMQTGTGTFDFMPGIVYAGQIGAWSWGASYRGRFPLAANQQGYMYGDLHEFNGWGGYSWVPGFTTTVRVAASMQGPIRGFDPEIRGAAAPANPNFYGGQRVEVFGGGSISGKFIGYDNWTLLGEAGLPVFQNLNGPQIEKNWQASICVRVRI